EHKVKILTKENENAKVEITTMQATIANLTEQVDTYLGAQQMVDILTNKNLSLEDQVRELQETVDNLKDRQIEQLQHVISDHERTILKFRETVKN
ncbi:unnamed protein product, partial [Rotaria sordida]